MMHGTCMAAAATVLALLGSPAGAAEPESPGAIVLFRSDGVDKFPYFVGPLPEKGDAVELVVTERDANTIRLHFRRKPAKGE